MVLSFEYNVSSEDDYDYFMFQIDHRTYIDNASGNTGWETFSIQLPSGTRTLRWIYKKDNMFSLNAGIYIEQTVKAMRIGFDDDWIYKLRQELNRHNFGLMAGAEVRFWSLTAGVKLDKLINDMPDRNYILSQDANPSNSSELRGIISNPVMILFQLGINIDVFRSD